MKHRHPSTTKSCPIDLETLQALLSYDTLAPVIEHPDCIILSAAADWRVVLELHDKRYTWFRPHENEPDEQSGLVIEKIP